MLSSKPVLQTYVATSAKLLPVTCTSPFSGSGSSGHMFPVGSVQTHYHSDKSVMNRYQHHNQQCYFTDMECILNSQIVVGIFNTTLFKL